MPTEAVHIAKANHNQALIERLLPDIDTFSDWITTIAFYKALHIVEAVFANNPRIGHGQNHEARERYLKAGPDRNKYRHIYEHYKPLYDASLVARYLAEGGGDFSEYLTSDDVRDLILGHYLHQVEQSACRFLKAPAALRRVRPGLDETRSDEGS